MAEETASKSRLPVWEENARSSIKTGIRRFSKPLADLVSRDANEGDTRLLITDFLCEALGYDKFEDLTTEYAVRYEFADYGVRINKQLTAFIEVKRAAQQLSQKHLRQVETYAVKEGLEWLILTNGQHWQVYHVTAATGRQVQTELLFEVDLLGDESPARKTDKLFYIHRDALRKNAIAEEWRRRAATSPAAVARALLSTTVLDAVRREIRTTTKFNADVDDLAVIVRSEVLKPGLAD
ncbi:putative type IV restriction endonuclease [Leifsonia sp. AK011]|uniref:type I restriction enzyme HsdR N-terminal domain-containing protein n=1 Tax=Leifsonia sp. AK011 TaxID=2723075 RepID=UPI0015C7D630|nr:type I restriction enzyme HsdR N-terminal domain-containing protein [Leifsonia sp. AK011]NYF11300.1 putative type IV restriction endonuclease [Leifsonia sp. AK011]